MQKINTTVFNKKLRNNTDVLCKTKIINNIICVSCEQK